MTAGALFEEVQEDLPVRKATCHEYLKHPARFGLVDPVPGPGQGRGRGRGRGRRIHLCYDSEEVIAACQARNEQDF